MAAGITVHEALAEFRRANGIPDNPAAAASWTVRIVGITVRLPNFAWRRAAIDRHDLHHLITGYPCTLRGEAQLAAWEFAAGRFPHAAATAFCLPLAIVGLIWSPRLIIAAFGRGRDARSLYRAPVTQAMLAAPWSCFMDEHSL